MVEVWWEESRKFGKFVGNKDLMILQVLVWTFTHHIRQTSFPPNFSSIYAVVQYVYSLGM